MRREGASVIRIISVLLVTDVHRSKFNTPSPNRRTAQTRTGIGWRARNGAMTSAMPRGSISSSA